jgi:hypothetical protein
VLATATAAAAAAMCGEEARKKSEGGGMMAYSMHVSNESRSGSNGKVSRSSDNVIWQEHINFICVYRSVNSKNSNLNFHLSHSRTFSAAVE